MAEFILECKSCGAQISCNGDTKLAVCKYCGTLNTVAMSAETEANSFNRANSLRRNNEFDRAIAVYESILSQNPTEAEAYWGIVLCKYGIEYVEDEGSGTRIPTCHRAQYDSILNDPDFQKALDNAPYDTRSVYESEAHKIDRLQKRILEISAKESAYDVFLCYKETDENGERSEDSVLTQEIYYELTKRGLRVFFAPKTLEGKLGDMYEPIIFAALNSAKVMVVAGTKPEHFESPWVRNEWNRFRDRIKHGENVTLIPAYKSMSPYELPEEFSSLQALDMAKLGFMQDLCDGIEKIIGEKKGGSAPVVQAVAAPAPTEALLQRAYLFLEDQDFQSADEYFERVLDQNPGESRAYIGKLLVDCGLSKEEMLNDLSKPIDGNGNYQKAIRFAAPEQKALYEGYNQKILANVEEEKRKKEEEKIRLQKELEKKKEKIRREAEEAKIRAQKAREERLQKERLEKEKLEQEERERKARRIKFWKTYGPIFVSIIAIAGLIIFGIIQNNRENAYQQAITLLEEGKYEEATLTL